jgi:hypothetical protein
MINPDAEHHHSFMVPADAGRAGSVEQEKR